MNKNIQAAYTMCKPARDILQELGALLMEETTDKAGIIWQRWVVYTSDTSHVSVIVFATPTWWDVFTPLGDIGMVDVTLAAIKALKP